jgi:hypothetical protein
VVLLVKRSEERFSKNKQAEEGAGNKHNNKSEH